MADIKKIICNALGFQIPRDATHVAILDDGAGIDDIAGVVFNENVNEYELTKSEDSINLRYWHVMPREYFEALVKVEMKTQQEREA